MDSEKKFWKDGNVPFKLDCLLVGVYRVNRIGSVQS